MKKSNKITLCAVMAALATVFMLLAYFPYFTYAVPAFSSLFIMIVVIEINCKWAFGAYLAASVLVFLLAEPESKLIFILFLGYYPILKALADRLHKPVLEWLIKLAVFNAAVLLIYLVFSNLFGFSAAEFGQWGKIGAAGFLAAGNLVLVVYDIALSRLACTYMQKIHPRWKSLKKH